MNPSDVSRPMVLALARPLGVVLPLMLFSLLTQASCESRQPIGIRATHAAITRHCALRMK
jgi:hypothetical protein